MTTPTVPHQRTIVGFCLLAVLGFATCSWWVVMVSSDAALRGDVIGTWKSFATLAFGFWIGSSSGGKSKDVLPNPPPAKDPTGEP